jgi:hypothetical protein
MSVRAPAMRNKNRTTAATKKVAPRIANAEWGDGVVDDVAPTLVAEYQTSPERVLVQ